MHVSPMVKKKSQTTDKKKEKQSAKAKDRQNRIWKDERVRIATGLVLSGFALYLLFALLTYLFTWKADQSLYGQTVFSGPEITASNWSGKSGAWLSNTLVHHGFGLAAFFLPLMILLTGLRLLHIKTLSLLRVWKSGLLALLILSFALGYLFEQQVHYLGSGPGGNLGYFLSRWLNAFMGKLGTGILLIVVITTFLLFTFQNMIPFMRRLVSWLAGLNVPKIKEQTTRAGEEGDAANETEKGQSGPADFPLIGGLSEEEIEVEAQAATKRNGKLINILDEDREKATEEEVIPNGEDNMALKIRKMKEDDLLSEKDVDRKLEEFNPRLDLSSYTFPTIGLLREHKSGEISVTQEELIANKKRILETLGNYNIQIDEISATIGPTVTLYEIVPAPGVRIARIKNLEDDIALSLSALGIRIIAPIPGRGTIGIEVPNSKPEIVSLKSLIASRKFQESKFELALALGKTIDNEPYIIDLTKMPHILVAGATGQGKSVGLNVILTSLLYKKHPAELKLVLIDPKKVELTLFSRIERHYLAKLPGMEEAIITDTKNVVNTLNSMTIEMDQRYELLKSAHVRNIKEYNQKFKARKLSPDKGHRFLPYLVLCIDEFADLIMTAGKEVETPLARLAQLARAVGIHLVIATQRPTTNIITGVIKANFPARIAFRVMSGIDSRTILDASGANQLIGRGDMLVSFGSDLTRIQCAFIDTPEIEEITEFVGNQRGYPEAWLLPEYEGESESETDEIDLNKKDELFGEAARVVVLHQQGSTSLIQRKLSIGYNRAGRIIDQLEAAGIVGPFEGSKARNVLIPDEYQLEQFLNNMDSKSS